MKTKKRQKLCHNCEGEVDLDVIVCPFCAADLREEKPEQASRLSPPAHKQALPQESLYPPPYAPRSFKREEEIPPTTQPEEPKGMYGPTVLLTLGAQLLFLGFFILFFSNGGELVLKWDARFWYFYVLTAIPLLIFGFKSLK